MQPRGYQVAAHDAIIDHIRVSVDPCLVEAVTAAGKSHIIASLAETIHKMSHGKHVLNLAPKAELVKQNRAKFLKTGKPASVFSASAGAKCLRHPVVFGTPGTVKNSISRFGKEFAAVVIDEAHGITPTVKHIIEKLREQNPKLRVIGFTGTPHRLGEGYIYKLDEKGKPNSEDRCRDPYFTKKVYTIGGHELIEQGFITPPVVVPINSDAYDTSRLLPNTKHKAVDIEAAFVGHGRLTASIVAEVVERCRDRRGVMFFAATIQHAEEVMASLPAGARLITGDTPRTQRDKIYEDFEAQAFKYLVNVDVLTTGFDAPHVDAIAILRASESPALIQQIIGRGLRLYPEKPDCWVFDYGGNIDKHFPDGDLFNPEIRASFRASEKGANIEAECVTCGTVNQFSPRPNNDGYPIDKEGYFVDLDGNRLQTDHGPMPAHFGRRCQGMHLVAGHYLQCAQRWSCKRCPECDAENDIAAKYCTDCRAELIDPNEKLIGEFRQFKRDPTNIQTDVVLSWEVKPTISRRGDECTRVDYVTEYRRFSMWYFPNKEKGMFRAQYLQWLAATNDGKTPPKTITYKKDKDSGFYRVFDYNRPEDKLE